MRDAVSRARSNRIDKSPERNRGGDRKSTACRDTELRESIAAPTKNRPVPGQRDTKSGGTARNLVHAHQRSARIVIASLKHLNGIRTIRGKTITERPVRSGTPRPNVPVPIQRRDGAAACSDLYDASQIIIWARTLFYSRRSVA